MLRITIIVITIILTRLTTKSSMFPGAKSEKPNCFNEPYFMSAQLLVSNKLGAASHFPSSSDLDTPDREQQFPLFESQAQPSAKKPRIANVAPWRWAASIVVP